MAGRYSNPVPQYQDDNTVALAGGLVYFYVSGASTTPQATYSDASLTTPNANPVVLDAAGRLPNVFAAYDKVFRVVLKTSAGVTVWTRDNVQFADVTELVALAAELQAQIDNIETIVINGNPVRNPTTELVTTDDSVTLTTAFLPHVCVAIDGRVAGTVTAGTMTSGSLAGLGTTDRQAKMAGVSGDSSSVVEWRFRIGSREALRLSDKTVSMSAAIRQESGLTSTTTIALYVANAVDDFSAVTLLGSTASSTTTSVNTAISYAGLALADVSNGLELIIKTQPGASFSAKDFYLTDIKIEVAASATTFVPPSLSSMASDVFDISDMVFRDAGTANAIVVTTRQALSLYDGLTLTVLRTATSTGALTLAVDGNAAATVRHRDGSVCGNNDTLTTRVYTFRYDSANSRFALENPEKPTFFSARAWVNFNGTGTVAIRASGNVTSITDNGTGDYTVNFTVALPDADYAPVVNTYGNDGARTFASGNRHESLTASAYQFLAFRSDGTGAANGGDSSIISVAVFR